MTLEQYQQAHPDRMLLKVRGQCIYDNDRLFEHARIARARGFPELVRAQQPPYDSPIVIVGSGLSAKESIEAIREEYEKGTPIMAVKGAHDWLDDQGITPDYAVAADPTPERARIFKRLNGTTIFLLASQMHPDTWDYMGDCRVILWHSETTAEHRKAPEWEGTPLVPGGSTTGLRAISLAYLLGFRDVHLYGFDSCVSENGEHKLGGIKPKDTDSIIEVFVGERSFRAALSLIPQVQCLMPTLMNLPGIKVEAHGDGYFQEVLRVGKAQGWPV